jgi:hypothetical protein
MDSTELLIQQNLDAGEKLLWHGQPRQGIVFTAIDIFLIPFSLLWGGFALFWEYMVLFGAQTPTGEGPPWPFALFGLPFVLMGLYIMFGRFWTDAQYRKNLIYAVTDRRALIVKNWINKSVTSISLPGYQGLNLTEHGDGRGTIDLTNSQGVWWMQNGGFGMYHAALGRGSLFFQIEKPKEVFRILREQTKISAR